MNKVLLIANYAGCPRVWKMASTLARNRFDVTVLEWDRDSKLASREYITNICVYRMKLKAHYGFKLLLKLPLWWIYVSFYLIFNDFSIVQPQNLDNLIPAWIISRIKRMKIVYDIADFYADAFGSM